MFNAGRIINRRHTQKNLPAWILVPKQREKFKSKYRRYVPFVWQALVASIAGILIIALGAGLCVVGYHADYFLALISGQPTDQTLTGEAGNVTATDEDKVKYLKLLTYAGPAVMSCGGFVIVFSCVVVCELREKAIELMVTRDKLGIDSKGDVKVEFFKSVVEAQYPRNPGQLFQQEDEHQQQQELISSPEEGYFSSASERRRSDSRDAKSLSELAPLHAGETLQTQNNTPLLPSGECDFNNVGNGGACLTIITVDETKLCDPQITIAQTDCNDVELNTLPSGESLPVDQQQLSLLPSDGTIPLPLVPLTLGKLFA